MAKHLVKCFFCQQTFDANKEPFIMVNSRRYAHEKCFNDNQKQKTKDELDKEELETYIKQLFNIPKITPKIQRQIKKYVEENQYTYSGIRRSLIYFFEVKKKSLDKANGGIGIVEWIYQDAFNYYYDLWLAQQRNQNKDFVSKEVIITIKPPQRKVKKRKLFSFLDKEDSE